MPKRQQKNPQSKIDAIRADWDDERQQEFNDFCRHNRNNTDIHRYLVDLGCDVSISAVHRWRHANFPIGEKAKALNALAINYRGIDVYDSLEFALGIAFEQLNRLQDLLNQFAVIKVRVENQEDVSEAELQLLKSGQSGFLMMVPTLLRELRSIAGNINEYKFIRDKRELEMAGAEAVVQELLIVFKDLPIENAIQEACRGAIAKLEGR